MKRFEVKVDIKFDAALVIFALLFLLIIISLDGSSTTLAGGRTVTRSPSFLYTIFQRTIWIVQVYNYLFKGNEVASTRNITATCLGGIEMASTRQHEDFNPRQGGFSRFLFSSPMPSTWT